MKKVPRIIHLDRTDSTNDYALSLLREGGVKDFTVIRADDQIAGKGRKQRDWHSSAGLNLTVSIILFPRFLEATKQFFLSMAAALSIAKTLDHYTPGIQIKWPNDIYLNNDKIAGILIENSVSGSYLDSSVTGIGINVNESPMPDGLRAVSLKQATGRETSLERLLNQLLESFSGIYSDLQTGKGGSVKEAYESRLYFRNRRSRFAKGAEIIEGTPLVVNDFGHLILGFDQGERQAFNMDEITLLDFS